MISFDSVSTEEIEMTYSALDIADYVVNYCHTLERSISNLKLQKILYYIQGNSLKYTNAPIISEDFYVWQHGPVIPEVYYKFSKYAASSIKAQQNENLKNLDELSQNVIKYTTEQLIDHGAWELVQKTHEEDPWKYNYEVYGYKSIIPLGSMQNYFCE